MHAIFVPSKNFRYLIRTVALSLSLVFAASTSFASSIIQFDANGGADGFVPIGGLSTATGNAVAIGSIPILQQLGSLSPFELFQFNQSSNSVKDVASNQFITLFQTTIDNTTLPQDAFPGLGSSYQLTFVASVREYVQSLNPDATGAIAKFGLSADQTGSFVEIYYHSTVDAFNGPGTKFDSGTLILSATPTSQGSTVFDSRFGEAPVKFTNYAPFGNFQTVEGQGSVTLSAIVNPGGANPGFFGDIPAIISGSFTSQVSLPFTTDGTDASLQFFGTNHASYTPNIGFLGLNNPGNGVNGLSGTDFQFKVQGSVAFQLPAPVPEPSTIISSIAALTMTGVFTLRRKKA